MKADAYTKLVLTIIAVNLSVLALRDMDLITSAQAADEQPVVVVPVNKDGSMNVRVIEVPDVVDVNLAYSNTTVDVKVRNQVEVTGQVSVE